MKLSVFSVLLGNMSLEKAAQYLHKSGVQAIEIGCGGFPGKAHCDPVELLADPKKIDEMKKILADNELEIAALSTHGNAVHPNKDIAKAYHDDFVNAVLLAEKLGVDRVVTFSGCPGDSENSKYPNSPKSHHGNKNRL